MRLMRLWRRMSMRRISRSMSQTVSRRLRRGRSGLPSVLASKRPSGRSLRLSGLWAGRNSWCSFMLDAPLDRRTARRSMNLWGMLYPETSSLASPRKRLFRPHVKESASSGEHWREPQRAYRMPYDAFSIKNQLFPIDTINHLILLDNCFNFCFFFPSGSRRHRNVIKKPPVRHGKRRYVNYLKLNDFTKAFPEQEQGDIQDNRLINMPFPGPTQILDMKAVQNAEHLYTA